MKKYLFLFAGLLCVTNVYAEGVVLSDTYVADDESYSTSNEEHVVVQKSTSNSSVHKKTITRDFLYSDLSDPLFLVADNRFLSDTYLNIVDEKIRLGEKLSYGINNSFVIHADMLYQWDVSGRKESGFSSTEIGGTYRMSHGFNDSRIISDALFGLKVWGSEHVRTPEYADSTYYAGLRFGRQYTGITLAGTVKSTWVFDDTRGLSYIDFIPEAYFRFQYDWRAGVGFDIRKSTSPRLLKNQEWVNLSLLRQYGNTQYVGQLGYEFEDQNWLVGARVKILF